MLLARLAAAAAAAALPSAMTIVYEREASRAVREGESHQSCPISLVLSWQKMQLIKKGKEQSVVASSFAMLLSDI